MRPDTTKKQQNQWEVGVKYKKRLLLRKKEKGMGK